MKEPRWEAVYIVNVRKETGKGDLAFIGTTQTVDIAGFEQCTMEDMGLDRRKYYNFKKNFQTEDWDLYGYKEYVVGGGSSVNGYTLTINTYAKAFKSMGNFYYIGGFTVL